MEKKQKTWLIVAVIAVILVIVIILSFNKKKEPTGIEEGLPEVKVEDLPAAPEVEVKEVEPVAIAPGASEVTSEGEVLAPSGEIAKNETVPGGVEAPKPSESLTQEKIEELKEESIVLNISSEKGFEPKQFKVKPGQVVNLVVIAANDEPHGLRFTEPSLTAVAVDLNAGESRAITFKAPEAIGEYNFHCTAPGHKRHGEIGSMFVTEE